MIFFATVEAGMLAMFWQVQCVPSFNVAVTKVKPIHSSTSPHWHLEDLAMAFLVHNGIWIQFSLWWTNSRKYRNLNLTRETSDASNIAKVLFCEVF